MRRLRSMNLTGLKLLVVLASITLPSCESDGNFTIPWINYTTRPNYEAGIHSVRVVIFKNETMRQGLEFELTKAIVREIEAKTPFKVISGEGHADTELTGTITLMNKGVVLLTPLNEIRQGQMVMAVAVTWKDVRTGEYLTRPRSGPGSLPPDAPLGAQFLPPPPVIITSTADFAPEVGESISTAQKSNVDKIAIQIVSMMEKPW
ncbi:MAG TPA: LPS assembly lipoprotein LptE [Gemmataceae bacterium]|nr:LPS assembly lipoprotein LptE [Gemmataceae bacterium]